MAYKIDYIPVGKRQYPAGRKLGGWLLPTVVILLLTVASIAVAAKYGTADWLLPGDPAVTKAALTELIDALKAGQAFPDAVTAFCREVIRSGA